MRLFLTYIALLCAPALGFAQEEAKPSLNDVAVATPQLVYGVTEGGEVPFYMEAGEGVTAAGYFPAHQVVWAIRPQEKWMLVHYQGVTGWILKDDLLTLFTLDPETRLPQ
jgi:hypothetical protein